MIEFSLSQNDAEKCLMEARNQCFLPVRVQPEQIVVHLSRAYQRFNRPVPEVKQVKEICIPFWVFRRNDTFQLIIAAGLPFRLLETYQCSVEQSGPLPFDSAGFEIMKPDVGLSVALSRAQNCITEHPTETHVAMVLIPFHIVRIQRGAVTVPVLINAANADIILECPPTSLDKSAARRRQITAFMVFTGMVVVSTTAWMISGSMTLTIAQTILVMFGIRWMIVRGLFLK